MNDDSGFSLSELLVVLALLGVILAATFNVLGVVNRSRAISERDGLLATEVGGPLLNMERVLMQAIDIKSIADYRIEFVTDRDNNDLVEWHEIGIDANGVLTQKSWLTDAAQTKTTQVLDATWSTNCINRSSGTRFVNVLDATGALAASAADAKTVVLDLQVEIDGRTYRDSREIVLRNYERR